MTAKDIQRRLCYEHSHVCFTLPNYTPKNWFECDVFQVTKAGYFVEYEVKISRHDFKADGNKSKTKYVWTPATPERPFGRFDRTETERKHAILEAAKPPAPSRFYFVFPEYLYEQEPMHIPQWAGVIVVRVNPNFPHTLNPRYLRTEIIKKAPQLHREKLDPKVLEHARGVTYYRMHSLLLKTS